MTRTLRTDAVTVELGRGWWRARWPGGPVAGPYTVAVPDPGGARHRADTAAGAWRVEIGACDDRPGSWAHWRPAADGPAFAVHVPAEGPLLVVEAGPPRTGSGQAVAVLVDSPGNSAGESSESSESTSESASESAVVVARGRRAGTEWAVLAAGPEASRLVSEARR